MTTTTTASIRRAMAEADASAIERHLRRCEADFVPPLGQRVDLAGYAAKIHAAATTFELWQQDQLVGLVAAYLNDPRQEAGFITNVSLEAAFQRHGLAREMLLACVDAARTRGLRCLRLEVACENAPALALYRSLGFATESEHGGQLAMTLWL